MFTVGQALPGASSGSDSRQSIGLTGLSRHDTAVVNPPPHFDDTGHGPIALGCPVHRIGLGVMDAVI